MASKTEAVASLGRCATFTGPCACVPGLLTFPRRCTGLSRAPGSSKQITLSSFARSFYNPSFAPLAYYTDHFVLLLLRCEVHALSVRMQLLAVRLGQKRFVPTLIRQLHSNPAPKSPHPATPPNPTTGISPQPLPPSILSNYARKAVSPVTETFRAYGRAQRRRPWLVQVLTAVAVYTAGDLNAQLLFGNEDEPFDFLRMGRNIFIGAIFAIPGYEW